MLRSRAVGLWLLVLVAMIVGQVGLGGITRLTGSGLSITEWRPVTGAVPPLSEGAWREQFARYRQIPQFEKLNAHFTLDDFKRIYFWEWLHRLWGRLLFAAFIVPLIWFWRRGALGRRLAARLIGLASLVALQGFLGWFMVASGLQTLVSVSHLRLALHLLAALALLLASFWLALSQLAPGAKPARAAAGTWGLLALLSVQLVYGAFMAGLKAAAWAPSWPAMNGAFLPSGTFAGARAAIDDPLTVQFIHRGLAYVLAAAVLVSWARRWRARASGAARWARHLPAAAVLAQVALGAATVLHVGEPGSFLALAVAHQLGAVALALSLVVSAYFPAEETVAEREQGLITIKAGPSSLG